MIPVSRHFADIDGRQVHYRRCGSGPTLVLLHASPVSSRIYLPAMQTWGEHFTCMAFDTPGNGLSTPLPGDELTIADFADAQAKLLRQIGVESCIAYGRHTGASIAVEMAARHPRLVTLALTDGYPIFTQQQRDTYLSGYLSDLPASTDGSHVAWLWSRYRDQFVFWPWSKKSQGNRADCDMPTASFLHAGVIALMEAGNNYKGPYSAVFRHDALQSLDAATTPVCIASRPGDSLFYQLPKFPNKYWVETMPRESDAAILRELDIMRSHSPTAAAPPVADHDTPHSGFRRTFVTTGTEQLHVSISASGNTRPVVVIGPAPGALLWHEDILKMLADQRQVIGIDPAGCGESDPPADGCVDFPRQAQRIAAVVASLGIGRCDAIGIGPSAGIALELATAGSVDIVNTVAVDPLVVAEQRRQSFATRYAPDVSPRRDGTHMLTLWHQLRDSLMWFPWFEQTRDHVRPETDTDYDFADLERRFLSLLKHCESYQELWRSAWQYPIEHRLQQRSGACAVVNTAGGLVPVDRAVRVSGEDLARQFQRALDESAAA